MTRFESFFFDVLQKRSIEIPNLEKALYQLIINEVWPNLGAQRTRVALEWSNFNKVQRHINEEERELFSSGLLDTDDDNRILKLICKDYKYDQIVLFPIDNYATQSSTTPSKY